MWLYVTFDWHIRVSGGAPAENQNFISVCVWVGERRDHISDCDMSQRSNEPDTAGALTRPKNTFQIFSLAHVSNGRRPISHLSPNKSRSIEGGNLSFAFFLSSLHLVSFSICVPDHRNWQAACLRLSCETTKTSFAFTWFEHDVSWIKTNAERNFIMFQLQFVN